MTELKTVKEKDEAILKKYWRRDVQTPAKFEDYRLAFLETLKEFESAWNKHVGRIIVTRHRVDQLNVEVRPAHSASY